MNLLRDLDSDGLFKSSSSNTLILAVPSRPRRHRAASPKRLFTRIQCHLCFRFQRYRTQSNKALLIEAGSLLRCPGLLRDVAILGEMSWKSCCHDVAKENQSEEGNGLQSEPDLTFDNRRAGLCVSGHTDVQLAGAVILGVNISGVNHEGQRSAGVRFSPASQLFSSGTRLPYVKRQIEYLQICDISILEVHICLQISATLLKVVRCEFSSLWSYLRRKGCEAVKKLAHRLIIARTKG